LKSFFFLFAVVSGEVVVVEVSVGVDAVVVVVPLAGVVV